MCCGLNTPAPRILAGNIQAANTPAAWLPLLAIPQVLFTLALCWFLAALGVFVRDLAHVMGFVLTLWFFTTPICYPESSVPAAALAVMRKNPLFVLVRAYRAIFLEGSAPAVARALSKTASENTSG